MILSALADHGMTQELSGAALDVFSETIRLDAGLSTFHGGGADAVRIMLSDLEWSEVDPWTVYTASMGFRAAESRVGGAREGLVLRAWFVWPEAGWRRQVGEAGVADLDHKFRIAIIGGMNAAGTNVNGNPDLVWKDTWGAPPAGYVLTQGVTQAAAHGVLQGPNQTIHGSVEATLSDGQSCIVNALAIDTVFGVPRSTC